jgi:hypothetical protein
MPYWTYEGETWQRKHTHTYYTCNIECMSTFKNMATMINFVNTSNKFNLCSFYRSIDFYTTSTYNNNNNAVTNSAVPCIRF